MVAMRKETIEDMGATSIEDLTVMVPNVFVRENPSVDNFNIRGISGGPGTLAWQQLKVFTLMDCYG
ncbi:MAG: hypothetical protein CM1200mP10_27580 [Candidatus Neomarinimicrobiota bacterium]|nr:MAG: hypothetical protein CM1200mP10_27580 [Candidatus Neomarinimicrobiota bacterium]